MSMHYSRSEEPRFLSLLDAPDRDELLTHCERREVSKGTMLFEAGSPGHNVYVLEEGSAKIYHLGPNSKEVLLWFCSAGDIFGLSEICHGGERQVYAQACVRSHVLAISRDTFKNFLASHPAAALVVVDVLSHRLRGLGELVEAMVTSDVTGRVVRLIHRLGTRGGDRLHESGACQDMRLTHQDIANMVGTSRQSVTSALNLLKHLGAVQLRHRCIRIRDRHLLEQIAAGTGDVELA